jgi:hypothetical protein
LTELFRKNSIVFYITVDVETIADEFGYGFGREIAAGSGKKLVYESHRGMIAVLPRFEGNEDSGLLEAKAAQLG